MNETSESQNKSERVAIFIDGSNFYHSVRDTFDLHDNQIDFGKLIEVLKSGRLLKLLDYDSCLIGVACCSLP